MTSYIILTCDKDYQYLQDCVSSIEKQDEDKEIIIVNNGTKEIPNSISAHRNLNCVEGRRFGFQHAKGDYVRFVDADDIVLGSIDTTDMQNDICQCGVEMKLGENHKGFVKKVSFCNDILKEYSNGLWSRYFKRSFLEKVYEDLPTMEDFFMKEDLVLMKACLRHRPRIGFRNVVIYRYNIYRSYFFNKDKYKGFWDD